MLQAWACLWALWPLEADLRRGAEGSRALRLPDFLCFCLLPPTHPLRVITRPLALHSHMRVRLGEHNLRKRDGTEQLRTVSRIIPHPGYLARTHLHDLMLVRLAQPARLSPHVRPVSLPRHCPQAGEPCVVSGWGLVSAYEAETSGSPESQGAWGDLVLPGLLGGENQALDMCGVAQGSRCPPQ